MLCYSLRNVLVGRSGTRLRTRNSNTAVAHSYWLGGAVNDGKGEPSQSSCVSHGCVPARFRNVTVLNTARSV